MKIVPVIDLKGGVVVHARRGRRDEYAPLQQPAGRRVRAGRGRAGAVRDVPHQQPCTSPISTRSPASRSTRRPWRRSPPVAEPWVDAGATTPERAAALHRAGVARNVIGTESIEPDWPDSTRVHDAAASSSASTCATDG